MNTKVINKLLNGVIEKLCGSITDEKVKDIIRNGSYITGGCIPSMIMDEFVNDYDIYIIKQEDIFPVVSYYEKLKPFGFLDDLANERPFSPTLITENSINLTNKVQIITKFVGCPFDVIQNFDFAHIKSYYKCNDNGLIIEPDTYRLCIEKELVYTGSKYPLSSLFRVIKYVKKGWTVSRPTLIHIALEIASKFARYTESDMENMAEFSQIHAIDNHEESSGRYKFDEMVERWEEDQADGPFETSQHFSRKILIEQLNGVDPITIQEPLESDQRDYLSINDILNLIIE